MEPNSNLIIDRKPEALIDERDVLDAVSRAILNHMGLSPLVQDILELMLPLGPFDMGRVRLLDPKTNATIVAGAVGCHWRTDSEKAGREPLLRVIREVVQNGVRARVIDDVAAFPGLRSAKSENLATVIFLPIRAAGEAVGCLVLGSRAPLRISPERVRFLEAVANHVGIGVKKAGLFEETGRRARELAAVHAVTAAVSGSLDLEHILLKGLDTVLEVTEMEAGYILFLAEEPPKLIIKAHRGMSSSCVATLQDRIQPGGKIEQIIATKKPLLLENISPAHKGRFGGERITAAAWVPILSKEKVIGILTITSRTKRTVPQDRLPLLASIGNALSAALENARLFDDTKRNLERIRTLHEINLAVTSTLDLKSVLDTLLAKLEEALSFAFVATIRMFNQETRATELLACRNIAAETCRQAVPDGTLGLSGVVLERLAPAGHLHAPKDPRTANPGFFIENGLVSYVGLPLIAQGQTLGILAIFTKEEREFSGKEIEFLSAVAGHGAAATHY